MKKLLTLVTIFAIIAVGAMLFAGFLGTLKAVEASSNIDALCKAYTDTKTPNGVSVLSYVQEFQAKTQNPDSF